MMKRPMLITLLLTMIISGVTTIAQPDFPPCDADVDAPYMVVGSRGRVLPGDGNRVRAEPSLVADVVGTIPGGEEFQVVSERACVDGYIWWQVIYEDVVGWTAERDRDTGEAWIEPLSTPNQLADAEFFGISFTYDSFRHSIADSSIIERRVMSAEGSVREYSILLNDIILDNASISVLPLDAYAELAPFIREEVDALLDLLDTQEFPEDLQAPPMIPLVPVARPFQAAPEFLDFQNGVGVRFVTTYAQDTIVVLADTPVYEFMGITNDGQWLVSAQISLSSDLFPTLPPDELPYTNTTYLDYLREVEAQIDNNANDVTAFFPNLTAVDAMIESLLVEPREFTMALTLDDVSYELPASIAPYMVGESLAYEPFSTFADQTGPPVLRFSFGDEETYMSNNMMIYPVALTEELGIFNFDQLRQILTERPRAPEIDLFPRTGTGRFFDLQYEYVHFYNGMGIRYIADFLQEADLFRPDYVYVGLTNDEQYFVIVSRPIDLPALSAAPQLLAYNQMVEDNYPQFIDEFDTYVELALGVFEIATLDMFNPSIRDYDAFIRSLRIGDSPPERGGS